MDKQDIRERVWEELAETETARFPFPPHDRIPNFEGSPAAAARLGSLDVWGDAHAIKCNPDAPQRHVRERALEDGHTVFMAVPRLADPNPFQKLDPSQIDDPGSAATLSGASEYGRQVGPDAVPSLDIVVCGSVAVDEDGGRIGKGEGFSDLEFALLAEIGAVGPETTVLTTVHEHQIREAEAPLPHDAHDVPLDLVVTPERSFETETTYDRPTGIEWKLLDEQDVEAMPVLAARRP
jgi:5-formyltetrahydrofolate cyclo-ligase